MSFERTSFERMFNLGLYSKEQIFSFETNFERTTDKFRKNVIRSNDLSRKFAEVIEINSVIAYGELYIYVDLLGDF